MNRFHLQLRLQKLFPECEILLTCYEDFIIIRHIPIHCKFEGKFTVPVINDKIIHKDTARLMFLKEKYKSIKNK